MRPTSTTPALRPAGVLQPPPDHDRPGGTRPRQPSGTTRDDLPLVDAPPLFGPSALPGFEALARLNGMRVCTTALAGTVASGSVFAASFTLAALLRAQARHPVGQAAGCLVPVLGGALTAPNDRAFAMLTGLRATEPREPSLAHAAILPGTLWLVHAALRPTHPAASALASLLGTTLGSGLAEAAAQLSHREGQASRAAEDAGRPGTGQIAAGRALSLLPFAAFTGLHVFRGTRPHPLAVVGVAAGGWVLRDALVPGARRADAAGRV